MRVLHTSDWHVGRSFHGHDLLQDQRRVLAAIAELVAEHAVDVVVIAGDLYDRAIPSTEAIATLTEAFRAIRAAGAQIIASSGNHDSAPRLGAFTDFLAAGGLHLRTSLSGIAEPVLLRDDHGPVAFYPVPFLEPEVVRRTFHIDGAASHQAVMAVAMDRVRSDLAGRPATRSVVVAHAFIVGAVAGGSERSIAVGGVESVSGEVFDGIDYVALGHLHRPQTLSDRLRYSGSPLAYSFTEVGHRKSVWLVDLDANGTVQAQALELPVPRRLAVVSGKLSEILAGHDELTDHYLAVELTDPVRPLEAMRRLKEKFPYAVTLAWEPPAGTAAAASVAASGRAGAANLSDADLISGFLLDCRGSVPSEREGALIDQALRKVRAAEAMAG